MRFPDSNVVFDKGICKTAELIQPNLIQLKTNFESVQFAASQADSLRKTINDLK